MKALPGRARYSTIAKRPSVSRARIRNDMILPIYIMLVSRLAPRTNAFAVCVDSEDQVETVGPGETIFLPKEKAHAFYIRSDYLRTLIISLATTEEPAALDSYFARMAKPATNMDIPTHAVTYLKDDPSHAVEEGKKYGIKMLSPEEARHALPHFEGLGANLT
jgi:hypothetical protein